MSALASLGMEFGQHVLKLTHELLMAGTPGSLSEMERRIRETLLKLGQFLLGAWLTLQGDPYPEPAIACPCGGTAEYQCQREAVLLSLVGSVHYKRAYYLCPACHHGRFPLDERLGLRPGEMSAELESLVGMTGAMVTFAKGSNLFQQLTLVDISPQSMDKATEAMGDEVIKVEQELIASSHDAEALNTQERAGKSNQPLYGTLDAVKTHCREKRSADDDGWRDLKVGAWFHTDAKPPASPQDDWDIRAKDITYYCDFAEAQAFGALFWATGFQREALRARELIFVGDGADWIWNLVTEYFPQAIQIVDWFHAQEHLSLVAKAAIIDAAQRSTWLTQTQDLLWAGRVDEVIDLFQDFIREGHGADVARKAVNYFGLHRERMNYAVFRNRGYQIGSGTVESACKQMGIQRMKVPGAIWSTEGARRTAKARAALLSHQWDVLTARREHLPRVA